MYLLYHDKPPTVKHAQKMRVSNFIRIVIPKFINEYKKVYENNPDFSKVHIVERFLKAVNTSTKLNMKQHINGKLEYSDREQIKLTFTSSNLGKGFIFWFICNGCSRKVRILYVPPSSTSFLCRKCHKLYYSK